MTTTTIAPVVRSVEVDATPERAFDVFTRQLGKWWPTNFSIGASPMRDAILEPRQGGRWFEVGADGTECQWGEVLVWEPPHRLVLAWRIRETWSFDPQLLTEVEITFTGASEGRTEVRLEHRRLENYGEAAEQVAGIFASPGGWSLALESLRRVAEG